MLPFFALGQFALRALPRTLSPSPDHPTHTEGQQPMSFMRGTGVDSTSVLETYVIVLVAEACFLWGVHQRA